MKLKIPFITVLLFLLSCKEQIEQTRPNSFAPKVVEAKGYIVPKDSMAIPKSVPAGKPKIVKVGKPTVVPVRSNIHLAGIPKTVIAGTPKICTPGKDSFSLPKIVPAINRPFLAGIPEVVIAKDAGSKEQNPQNFSSFNKLQGLKSGDGSCLLQDKKGNIWMGTYGGGVSRYDGKNFTHFTEKEGLFNNGVWSICEDRLGNLWFGGDGGVSKFDGKNFTNFTEKEGLINASCIIQDKAGSVWISTWGGVFKYDGEYFTHFTEKEGLVNNVVNTIFQDRSGNLWFGTDGGVSRLDRDSKSFTNYTKKEGLSNNVVWSICEDRLGNLWFATSGGVSVLDSDGKTFMHYTEKEGLNNNVLRILKDKSGNLWFGSDQDGVWKYDGQYFTHFTQEDGLADHRVISMLEDRSGGLWFGSWSGGVSKYNGKIFTHFTRKEGLNYNDIRSIFADRSGNLWFGTDGGGVSKYDGNSFTNFTEKEGLDENGVESILEDKSGNLWFGHHHKGVSRLDRDGKNFTHFTEKEGLISTGVTCMLQDRSGILWFGTEGGVSKYDGENFTNYTKKEGLSSNTIKSILEDIAGNLWFGTWGGGVTKYDHKTFTHFTVKEGLSGNKVLGITEDSAGNLWIGTDRGVSGLARDEKTFTHLTEREGLSNDEVYGAIKDKSGNLWFSTAFGLNKLTPESSLQLAGYAAEKDGSADHFNNDRKADVLFKSYFYEDGFLGIGCNERAIFEDKSGTIWIGAKDRVTAFHPDGDKKDTIAPNIQLTGVALFNENIPWINLEQKKDTTIVLSNGVRVRNFKFDGISNWYYIPQHLSLPYNNNYLNFNFIGITTKSPHQVKYQYKLEGLDENWSALTSRNEVAYGNLPPSNYTFKIRAMNGDGYWSKEFNYSFTIRPPWWQTWWFRILATVFAGTLLYGFIQYRSRQLKASNVILEKKVTQRTNELNNSLAELKTAQDQLIQSEKMASLGELTSGIAHEIKNPLNFINNFSEINMELIAEIEEEQIQNLDENKLAEMASIIKTLKKNSEKINNHGHRIDGIVKGMLQHSRLGNLTKEPVNINSLCDESLKLAYHGFRAKEKSFHASFETRFDPDLPNIMAVPQDLSRVLLNLINNAFYTVNERKKLNQSEALADTSQMDSVYKPSVSVTTRNAGDKISIIVSDNGMGIPPQIINKIFQPFFTTKPTGEGTGLGLSMSYDIISKTHGGELRAKAKEGMGSDFEIILPVK